MSHSVQHLLATVGPGTPEFTHAVRNSQLLIDAAQQAGVKRFVHLSVLNPQGSSELPHFRSKSLVEQHLRESGLSHAIIRPGLILGPADLFLNNLAWMIRRCPLMAVPGDGEYRIQPLDARDLAACAVQAGAETHDSVTDAVGPETHTFNDLIDLVVSHLWNSNFRQATPRTPEPYFTAFAILITRLTDY